MLLKNVDSLYDNGIVTSFRERHYHRFDPLSTAETIAGDTDECFSGWSGLGRSSVDHVLHTREGK